MTKEKLDKIKDILKYGDIVVLNDTIYSLTKTGVEHLVDAYIKVSQIEPQVKQAACGKWQRKKPDKPCYFLHRYNKKDDHPSLFEAYIDTEVLCVANIQDDAFVETMEGFADGQFFIIEK